MATHLVIDHRANGASGDQLANGASGDQLANGASGDQLANGASGDQLANGASGDQLANGASGDQLANGASGDQLANGASGDQLANGASGDQLANGASGDQLANGASGDQLANGASGDTPLRHPEKAHRPDNPIQRKPAWIRVKAPTHPVYHETRALMRANRLTTVCEEAACPNIGECWSQRHATMMIMGDTCTRACAFCNVRTGLPGALDADEPNRVGDAVAKLGLKHVVVTSVDRDDLADGGAGHFAAVIRAIRAAAPGTTIEVLTPDFLRKPGAVETVIEARPDVFNHNLETVPRLYPTIRPGARYFASLRLLDAAKTLDPTVFTKSGLMVGLGESRAEILQVMDDLRSADVDFLTVGQYLQPTVKHAAIDRFVTPEEFADTATAARGKGFLLVSATPLTRSSYHADADFAALRAARAARLAAQSATPG